MYINSLYVTSEDRLLHDDFIEMLAGKKSEQLGKIEKVWDS
jgi:hypothetical protein